MSSHNMDVYHAPDAPVFLQQFPGRSSSVPVVFHYDVLSSCEVSKHRCCRKVTFICLTSFSHIIKYQDNVTNSPSTCDLMEKLNTSHAEIFMREYCKEKPTFTTGKKNVIQLTLDMKKS